MRVTDMPRPRQRHIIVCALLVCALVSAARAQSPAKEAGTITGRVTADGHGLAGVLVALMPTEFTPERKPVARAATGADGRYQIANVPPGSYYLNTVAPVYLNADANPLAARQGRLLNVAPGDRLDGLDFTLTRGGVITGRVRDAEGKPVVETTVRIMAADEADRRNPQFMMQFTPTPFMFRTDDRGVYRLFGLPAGRYYVYVGEEPGDNSVGAPANSSYYQRTYYGDANELAEAKPVEVTGGAETTGVDITVGKPARTYEAAGRVVDESGHAVANINVFNNTLNAQGRWAGGGGLVERTNERGEFRLKNLRPGRYAAYAVEEQTFAQGQGATYSDAAQFEIGEQDVSGLEIKLVRGLTMTGTLAVEGTLTPAARARLGELRLGAGTATPTEGFVPPISTQTRFNADGSFVLTGLRPGLTRLYLGYPQVKGFVLLRVERGGVAQPRGIEIAPGEQVTGVRVVVAYGAGVVRGQVQFPAGAPPAGERLIVFARRTGEAANSIPAGNAQVDELGRFVIENLAAGEYELLLNSYPVAPSAIGRGNQPADRRLVNVPDRGDVQVTLVFNANPPQ